MNTIYLYNVDGKIKTLLSYYLPYSMVITSLDDFKMSSYIITSDKNYLIDYHNEYDFKSIRNFDNHSLLIKISK